MDEGGAGGALLQWCRLDDSRARGRVWEGPVRRGLFAWQAVGLFAWQAVGLFAWQAVGFCLQDGCCASLFVASQVCAVDICRGAACARQLQPIRGWILRGVKGRT